ncbi:hypothetical protein CRUP_035158 [Coryphaenoides rupestris]|nr:hypothetical protein CRUP_035158 [Coryphaenoides rupestris]
MLQRDPKKRTSLELIEEHDWLRGVDPSPATKLATPLVSHRSLSEEEHGSIVQRLVLGGIADRDAITEALEANRYNHITATYFLLAERVLRERLEKESHSQIRSASPSKAQFRQSWPTRVDVHQDMSDGLGGPTISHPGGPQSPARSAESLHKGPRPKTALLDLSQRKDVASLLQPPSQSHERGLWPLPTPQANPLRLGSLGPLGHHGKTRSPSLFSVEEDEEEEGEPKALPMQVVLRPKAGAGSSRSPAGRLTCRMSAPVLNQIHEEISDEEDEEEDEKKGVMLRGPTTPRSLHLPSRLSSPSCATLSPDPIAVTTPVSLATPSPETSEEEEEDEEEDNDTQSVLHRGGAAATLTASGGETESEREPIVRAQGREKRGPKEPPASPCDGGGPGGTPGARGSAKAPSGLVESLKLMSLCLSSQFHSLTGGGGGGSRGTGSGGGGISDDHHHHHHHQERPVWRMCMGGSTGSLDKTRSWGDPLLDGSCMGTLRLSELDLARENHRNLKNRVLQMPLSDKTLSVNIQRSPREGLLFSPTPHSCCQVI